MAHHNGFDQNQTAYLDPMRFEFSNLLHFKSDGGMGNPYPLDTDFLNIDFGRDTDQQAGIQDKSSLSFSKSFPTSNIPSPDGSRTPSHFLPNTQHTANLESRAEPSDQASLRATGSRPRTGSGEFRPCDSDAQQKLAEQKRASSAAWVTERLSGRALQEDELCKAAKIERISR